MKQKVKTLWKDFSLSIAVALMKAPWELAVVLFRLMYGFRVEGVGNIPSRCPFILQIFEPSLIGVLSCGWLAIMVRLKVLGKHQEKYVGFMQESLMGSAYFRKLVSHREWGVQGPVVSHSAGKMALPVVDAYRMLGEGGLVCLNPYGEGAWDGRLPPMGRALAWLGLRTALPIVPSACSIGAYDIWPRWRMRPALRGRLAMSIGRPFTLCDTPQRQISEEDLARAMARLNAEVERLSYGPGGIVSWMGPVTRDGKLLERLMPIRRTAQPTGSLPVDESQWAKGAPGRREPAWKREIAQLLWRCPVCCTNDSLIREHKRFGPQVVYCHACATRWEILRIPGHDFRLRVVQGPPEIVGLEMALSAWYDEMKRDFQPSPIPVAGFELRPGEEAYLVAEGVSLWPHHPSTLFDGWTECAAPSSQPPSGNGFAGWDSLGEGRLVLTNQRLVWQGPRGELNFAWSTTRAVYLWVVNTLGLLYGAARYRIGLGGEVGLKWLTYAGTIAEQNARQEGRAVTVTPY